MAELHLTPAVDFELLVLIGGGEFSFGETREVDEFLVSRLGARGKRVAFLPTASGSPEYATHFGRYLAGIDAGVETVNVPIYRGRDNRRQKSLAAIASAGMIYVGGGVASSLLDTLRDSPAEETMKSTADAGTIVAAIGGAASCFGVATLDGTAPLPAFGWLEGTVIATAFDPAEDSMLRRLMSLPDVTLGLGIPPGTALAVARDGSTTVIGDGSVAAFRKR